MCASKERGIYIEDRIPRGDHVDPSPFVGKPWQTFLVAIDNLVKRPVNGISAVDRYDLKDPHRFVLNDRYERLLLGAWKDPCI